MRKRLAALLGALILGTAAAAVMVTPAQAAGFKTICLSGDSYPGYAYMYTVSSYGQHGNYYASNAPTCVHNINDQNGSLRVHFALAQSFRVRSVGEGQVYGGCNNGTVSNPSDNHSGYWYKFYRLQNCQN